MDGALGFVIFFCDVAVPVLQLLVLCAILYYVKVGATLPDFDWHAFETPPEPKKKRGK